MSEISVEEVRRVTPELVAALASLSPQLSFTAPPATTEHLAEIVASLATVLFIARAGPEIIGALTLVLFRIPTGLRAIIEDVVVDESARGRGVGERLTRSAIERAKAAVRSYPLAAAMCRLAAA